MNKGKRLIPEDLLDYVQDLNNNHPDPSAEWGGSSYTAGTGIDISEGEISIDNTVATKTFVENYAEPAEYLFELTGYQGQLNSQQIQKLQSLGADALGKKILVNSPEGVKYQFVIGFMMPTSYQGYQYQARNTQGVGVSHTATWYGISIWDGLFINQETGSGYDEYNWSISNNSFDLPLKSTDFARDPDTYEIGISSSIARTSAIPTVTNSITQGSTDAVTSGAVYNAIGDIESLLAAI